MSSLFILFLLGLATGVLSSFFGVGGGFLIIPCLYWLYPSIPPQVVISTSLGIIFLNCLVNIRNFLKNSLTPNWSLAVSLIVCMGLGSLIGGRFSFLFHASLLKLIVAFLLLYNGIMMIFRFRMQNRSPSQKHFLHNRVVSFSFIVLAGFLAGLTGVGGGIVILPVLLKGFRVPYIKLSLYSNLSMMGSTFVGAASYVFMENQREIFDNAYLNRFQWGHLNGTVAFCVFAGALFTAPLGVYLRKKVPEGQDRYIFGILLFFLSLRLFLDIIQNTFNY